MTGKSSYIKRVLKDEAILYWNLFDVALVARINENPALLRNQLRMSRRKSGIVILDEIQKVNFLLNEIHVLIEETDFFFLRLAALNNAGISNFSNIAGDLEVNRMIISEWFHIQISGRNVSVFPSSENNLYSIKALSDLTGS